MLFLGTRKGIDKYLTTLYKRVTEGKPIMHQVTVFNGRKIIRRETFNNQNKAFDFLEEWQDKGFAVDYKDMSVYKK